MNKILVTATIHLTWKMWFPFLDNLPFTGEDIYQFYQHTANEHNKLLDNQSMPSQLNAANWLAERLINEQQINMDKETNQTS